ncbi:MAG: hypothetical protein LBI03_05285 [Clostridiales bacterium]|nr:hypothetical protein [Clostridiales bacterium]
MKNNNVTVNFSKRDGIPVLKKFALYNSGILPLDTYDKDAWVFDGLRVDSLRIDLFLGCQGQPLAKVVQGNGNELIYDYEQLDELISLLEEHNVHPYWCWSYIPEPLQIDGDWRNGPSDLDQWQEMFRNFAEHYKEIGVRIPYNEIYNEPDCNDVFFLGNMSDYARLYISAVKGLLEGNPDAVVGGPSSAFVDVTGELVLRTFLDKISLEKVPMDFFTYHSYASDKKQYINRTNIARSLLLEYPEFKTTTELHLDEYNTLLQPFLPDGPAEHCRGAATMLTSFQLLLNQTDVTLAHWAQFIDTGYEPLGTIGTDGRLKAPYWAYWMYSQMPEERVSISGLPEATEEGLHGIASADENSACILLWNDSESNGAEGTLSLKNIPFKNGTYEVYEMNDSVDPYWQEGADTTVKPSMTSAIKEAGKNLAYDLPPSGFVLYRFLNEETQNTEPVKPIGDLIRKRYYFQDRNLSNYSFFDETDQTVYLGMNGEKQARSVVATEWSNLPDQITIHSASTGTFKKSDKNACFGIRVDYDVNGEYTKSVLYTQNKINPDRSSPNPPWGTNRDADEVIVSNKLLSGDTQIDLRSKAPDGWSGRAIITYDMDSAGSDLRTEIKVTGSD